jgi:hypothetical protein
MVGGQAEVNAHFVQTRSVYRQSPGVKAAAPAMTLLDDLGFVGTADVRTAQAVAGNNVGGHPPTAFDGPRLVKVVVNVPFDKLLGLSKSVSVE